MSEKKHHKQKRTNEEIAKEKAEMKKKYEDVDAFSKETTGTEKSERQYAKDFKNLYGIRKALVVLDKQRKLNIITNEDAVGEAVAGIVEVLREVNYKEEE